jgi:triacylglycerol lipase
MWLLLACTPDPGRAPLGETGSGPPDPEPTGVAGDTAGSEVLEAPLPILFVHGINGSAADWDTVRARLADDGWPAERLYARTFDDPEWGCNVDNAAAIDGWVDAILADSGADAIQLVAHSMGTLSSRYFVKNLQGTERVHRYVTLGGMHHGLASSCSPDFPFKPCVWEEICSRGELVTQLNADPATPGDLEWISIYGTADTTVPNTSSILEGAENLAIEGVTHDGPSGLQETASTYAVLREVLKRP